MIRYLFSLFVFYSSFSLFSFDIKVLPFNPGAGGQSSYSLARTVSANRTLVYSNYRNLGSSDN